MEDSIRTSREDMKRHYQSLIDSRLAYRAKTATVHAIRCERIPRSGLAADIDAMWNKRGHLWAGIPGLRWDPRSPDNPIHVEGPIGRRDVLAVSGFGGIAHVDVHLDEGVLIAHATVDNPEQCWVDPGALKEIAEAIACHEHYQFCLQEARFFQEEPWKDLEGLTPAQAVDALEELGWVGNPK